MEKIDIIFIDGIDFASEANSYLTYLYPIAAMLEKYKIEFRIFNLQLYNLHDVRDIVQILINTQCRIVGMTTNSDNIYNVCEISKAIKQYSDIKIILGGPQATFDDINTIISVQ